MEETTSVAVLGANEDSGNELRRTTAAMRLSFAWFGTRKTLTSEQKTQAADTFHAEGKFLSASKRLLDVGDASFRAVTAVRTQANAYFKGASLPYPEPGIRLVPQGSLDQINIRMQSFCEELDETVQALDARYEELKFEARDRLGDLYNETDYPESLRGLFEISWEFPSVEPPDYLRRLNPELYRQESERVKSRFGEAVQLAEIAFTEELNRMVEHLGERLSGNDDGTPKVFRDSAIDNLTDFFERFKRLNIGSCEELDDIVARAESVLVDVQPQRLRDSGSLRSNIASRLSAVQSSLDGLMVNRPRRNILRK